MERQPQIAAAEALNATLNQFVALGESLLQSVWEIRDGRSLERLIFQFEALALKVGCHAEDDSVEVEVSAAGATEPKGFNASLSPHWKKIVGQRFGWGWITVNQQGYCDGILLSFSGIDPNVMLSVAASCIRVSTMGPVAAVVE